MLKLIRRRSEKAGLPPGTLVHIGEKKTGKAKITVFDYDEAQFQETEAKTVEECFPFKDTPEVTWIDIDGIHDLDTMEKIGKLFDLHPLVLEDIVNTGQRPKMEDFDDYIFIVTKVLSFDENKGEVNATQLSIILGSNYVISFQESNQSGFNPIGERIRTGKGRIRKMGADYLAYTLLDTIVDNYFAILERLGEMIQEMEEELVTNPTAKTLHAIHNLTKRGNISAQVSLASKRGDQ